MNKEDIGRQRLANQQVVRHSFGTPGEVVRWMGAMQAQDYLGALWAIGARLPCATEQDVECALAEKTIVRTWPMRGTIHFVAPADVRWMLELLTPRVVQNSQGRLRQLGLDAQIIAGSADVVGKALQGGQQLTRKQLYAVLEEAGIAAGDQRGLHILGQLAHNQLICFGARAGKQPTFTLLDEWAPGAKSLPRDEALAMLARRYFTSHGPASLQDFVWWAGLTIADAKAALGAVAAELRHARVDGQDYYAAEDTPAASPDPREAFLLPPFDEFLVAYRDRSASLDPRYNTLIVPGSNGIFNPIVVIDGRVVGTWKRAFQKSSVAMSFAPFTSFDGAQVRAITAAAERYACFVGKEAAVTIQ
jgi:hypothetical protein